jgi:hypothetical protein
MKQKHSRRSRLWYGVGLALLLGCNKGGPELQAVTGAVLLDGAALEAATVTFVPVGGDGIYASGITGSDGRFVLNSSAAGAQPGAGAVEGDYQVTITKSDVEVIMLPDPDDPAYDPLASVATKGKGKGMGLVPKDYGSKETSGLTATVGAGSNDLTFELVSSYKAKPTK